LAYYFDLPLTMRIRQQSDPVLRCPQSDCSWQYYSYGSSRIASTTWPAYLG